MKTRLLFLMLFMGLFGISQAQVSINQDGNDPHGSAMLDVSSTEKGLLIPRMSSVQRADIENPANGLMVFDTSTNTFWFYSESTSQWEEMGGAIVSVLNDLLDAKTDANSVYIGYQTAVNDDGDNSNTVVGIQALKENTAGNSNTAMGNITLQKNTTGSENTALGTGALNKNATGNSNVAVGFGANGFSNTTGSDNVAVGNRSLLMNSGEKNTVIGKGAGQNSGNSSNNVLIGYEAGKNETESNKLYIENSDSENPLIGGDFEANEVQINGELQVTEDAGISGNMSVNGTLVAESDLEVNQNLSVTETTSTQFLKVEGGNPAVGKVLTSDADGNASWQNAAGGATELNDLSDAKTNGTSVFVGNLSGQNVDGIKNVTLGVGALVNNESSSNNVAIGYFAGFTTDMVDTYGNVIIGNEAGYGNEENNQLIIDNSGTDTPLLHGDFAQDHLKINGTLQITGGNPGEGKVFTSNANGVGSWVENTSASDINGLADGKSDNSSVYLGNYAGLFDDNNALNNTGVGVSSLKKNTAGEANTAIGFNSLSFNTIGNYNTAIGFNSLASNTTGNSNIAMGRTALVANISGNNNTAIGDGTMSQLSTGFNNVAIGNSAISHNQTGQNNTILGFEAGKGTSSNNMSGSILIGHQAGYYETNNNKLYIENSNSNTPLIGGDFEADFVDINGDLNVNGQIKITGGTPGNGKVLTSDANGNASWQTNGGVGSIDDLSDAKNDGSTILLGSTGVGDDGNNSNTGTGKNTLNANTSGQFNAAYGHSSLLANSTGSDNAAFGSNSMELNTTGSENTAVGSQALYLNGQGNQNTAVGFQAGYGTASSNGSGNVFLGHKAGYQETGNNKLYIDNSDTYNPLIYGDFELNKVNVNGHLEANNVTVTENLEANDVTITGNFEANDVIADSYSFPETKTGTLIIPAAAFTSGWQSEGYGSWPMRNSRIINWGDKISIDSDSQTGEDIVAPLFLPNGVELDQISTVVSSDPNTSVFIYIQKAEFGQEFSWGNYMNITIYDQAGDKVIITEDIEGNQVIDNENWMYYVRISINTNENIENRVSIHGVKIKYSYSTLDH